MTLISVAGLQRERHCGCPPNRLYSVGALRIRPQLLVFLVEEWPRSHRCSRLSDKEYSGRVTRFIRGVSPKRPGKSLIQTKYRCDIMWSGSICIHVSYHFVATYWVRFAASRNPTLNILEPISRSKNHCLILFVHIIALLDAVKLYWYNNIITFIYMSAGCLVLPQSSREPNPPAIHFFR